MADIKERLAQRIAAASEQILAKTAGCCGEESAKCICHLAYKTLAPLKKKFRLDVSSGDLVLLKASHSMNLSSLLEN